MGSQNILSLPWIDPCSFSRLPNNLTNIISTPDHRVAHLDGFPRAIRVTLLRALLVKCAHKCQRGEELFEVGSSTRGSLRRACSHNLWRELDGKISGGPTHSSYEKILLVIPHSCTSLSLYYLTQHVDEAWFKLTSTRSSANSSAWLRRMAGKIMRISI